MEEKHTLTLLWRIENIILWEHANFWGILTSPEFRAHALEEKSLTVGLPLHVDGEKSLDLKLYIRGGSLYFPIDCEWSFIDRNGSPLVSGTEQNRTLKEYEPLSLPGCPTKEDVFHTRKTSFLPDDTLIVQCRIWKSCGNLSNNELISFKSRLEASENSFLWAVPRFSSLQLNQEVTTPVTFEFPNGSSTFQLKFLLKGTSLEDASINFELTVVSIHSLLTVFMKVKVLGYEQKTMENKFNFFSEMSKHSYVPPEFVSRKELLSKESDCLRYDVLSLRCEFKAVNSHFTNSIQKKDYGFSNPEGDSSNNASTCLDTSSQISEKSVESRYISLHRQDPLAYLGEDLLSLYQDQTLSDYDLRTGGVSFPVHKVILSARSPVFKAMFSSDMKESASNWQDVPDLDVHTLNRMLTFLYGGTVEPQLQWERAAQLYYAADKYQIRSLSQQCSSILRSNISVSNVPDILTLADKHQDSELISFTHEFVLKNFDKIMQSEEWDNFLQTDPVLAGNTAHQLYKKKLQTKLL